MRSNMDPNRPPPLEGTMQCTHGAVLWQLRRAYQSHFFQICLQKLVLFHMTTCKSQSMKWLEYIIHYFHLNNPLPLFGILPCVHLKSVIVNSFDHLISVQTTHRQLFFC